MLHTSSLYCYNSSDISQISSKFAELGNKILELTLDANQDPNGMPKMIQKLLDQDPKSAHRKR